MGGEAYFIDRQVVRLEDPFGDCDLILALGGGGEGTIGRMRGRQVVSLDRSRSELEEAPDGPIKVLGEATELPFLDAAFDAVAAFFFFLYVSPNDRAAALREARRVLKPQGAILRVGRSDSSPRQAGRDSLRGSTEGSSSVRSRQYGVWHPVG